jgi:hypothetical protein
MGAASVAVLLALLIKIHKLSAEFAVVFREGVFAVVGVFHCVRFSWLVCFSCYDWKSSRTLHFRQGISFFILAQTAFFLRRPAGK